MPLTVNYDGSIVDEGNNFYKHYGGTVGVRSVTLSVKVLQVDPGECVRVRTKIENKNGKVDWVGKKNLVTKFVTPDYFDIDLATDNGLSHSVRLDGQDKNVLYEITLVGTGNAIVEISSQLDSF